MALMQTGITVDTQRRLLRDQGLVYLDYGESGQALLGATKGGNSVEITPEWIQERHDGQPGDVKGDKRLVGVSVKLTVNLSEAASNAAILASIPGAESSVDSDHNVITRDRQIVAGDYFTNITLLLEKSGTSVLWYFKLKNPLATSPYKVDAKEKDNSINTIEFTAHYTVNDLDTEPWEIGNPVEGVTGFYTLSYSAGANGSIIGDTTQTIQDGDDGNAVYASADTGYHFVKWTDDSTYNPRQDIAIAADVTQEATFAID